jgi:hypothetical protein
MHFGMKSYLKNTHNHAMIPFHVLSLPCSHPNIFSFNYWFSQIFYYYGGKEVGQDKARDSRACLTRLGMKKLST